MDRTTNKQIPPLKCVQVNVQHSRASTSNLIEHMTTNKIDIAFIQEPYNIRNKLAGIPKHMKIYSQGHGRKRAAVIVNNKNLDVVAITQLSEEDGLVIEAKYHNFTFIGASMYFDILRNVEEDLQKIKNIIDGNPGNGIIFLVDSNARSKLWYDIQTNPRGQTVEDFIITNNLYLANNNIDKPTFETNWGRSWVDLTLTNSRLLKYISNWDCGVEESSSDHNLIALEIGEMTQKEGTHFDTIKYLVNEESFNKFDNVLTGILIKEF